MKNLIYKKKILIKFFRNKILIIIMNNIIQGYNFSLKNLQEFYFINL